MKTTYRQGDILFIREEDDVITDETARGQLEIAKGEATGHAHVLEAPEILFNSWGRDWVTGVKLPVGGVLRHDEHAPIELPGGFYSIRRQREYSYRESVPAYD